MFLLRFPFDSDVGTAWDSFSYPWSPSLTNHHHIDKGLNIDKNWGREKKKENFLKKIFFYYLGKCYLEGRIKKQQQQRIVLFWIYGGN